MGNLTPEQENLAKVRAEIDALDQVILRAVERRAEFARQVSQAKSFQHTFRPGREADLLRNLLASTKLSPLMIEGIWRHIIAGNLTSQSPLNIATYSSDAVRASVDFRFGQNVTLTMFDDGESVVNAVASGACQLGAVPHWDADSSWLKPLHDQIASGGSVYINTITPFLSGHQIDDAVILAPILPDASAADHTVIIDDEGPKLIQGHDPQASGILGIIQTRDMG